MSWDGYVDNLKGRGVPTCGFYGTDGSRWAESEDLHASPAEVSAIVNSIKSGNFDVPYKINGSAVTLIGSSPTSATFKTKETYKDDTKFLFHVSLAKTCAVVGGKGGAAEREAKHHSEALRDYLADSGY